MACTPAWALWLPVVQSGLLAVAAAIIAGALIRNARLSREAAAMMRAAVRAELPRRETAEETKARIDQFRELMREAGQPNRSGRVLP